MRPLLLIRKLYRLPLLVRVLIVGACVTIISFIYLLSYISYHDYITDPVFLEEHKCPACYGKSFCEVLHAGNVTFESFSKIRLTDYVNTKNIYFAHNNDGTKLVLKKLAHNTELEAIDKKICQSTNKNSYCDVAKYFYLSSFAKQKDIEPNLYLNLTDMVRCSSQRLLTKIYDNYKEKYSPLDLHVDDRLHMAYTLMVNSEPILMQTFSPEEGWPFPKYYGACGRFIAEEYVGKTVFQYSSAPWEERVDYGYQILKIADLLTNHKEGYALYLTDVGFENLAVNKHGKVIIIDLENIIVVDKAKLQREKRREWNVPHYSSFDECPSFTSCLSFSYDDMCTHLVLDLNYYAVCRNLLSKYATDAFMPAGLLHSLPKEIEEKYKISEMLEECAKPSFAGARLEVVPKLLSALEEIRQDYL